MVQGPRFMVDGLRIRNQGLGIKVSIEGVVITGQKLWSRF